MATEAKTADLYRMVMPNHICPYGLKALDLLKRRGFMVEDHPLRTRDEVETFKAEHSVATTPQIFVDAQRIGGFDDLRRYFGQPVRDASATSYRPVIVIFAVAALIALAASWAAYGALLTTAAGQWFIAFTMCILAMLKLQDLDGFSSMFLNYDLLARRFVPYSFAYPFAELGAGVLMAAGALRWLSIPVALFIGTIGAASVVKAVCIEQRELKCACVGGNSNVPLGFISLTENVMMVAMALWMLFGRH